MKIGILTLPLSVNFGGILQAFALKTVIEGMGNTAVFLNRQYGRPGLLLLLFRFGSVIKCFVRRYILGQRDYHVVNPFRVHYNVRTRMRYNYSALAEFIEKKINRTVPFRSTYSLARYCRKHKFDCLLVGSDQVWNESYSPDIADYFLCFLSDSDEPPRIVYAASGLRENIKDSPELKKCIASAKKFKAISVRENTAVGIINDIFGLKATQVLDPTLLLCPETYLELCSEYKENIIESDNILTDYILDYSGEKRNIVDDICRTLHLKNISILPQVFDEEEFPLSIEKWLFQISNADFVVTDSYHGCIFSIIFKKQFIVIENPQRGNDRFETLLRSLGLENRIISLTGTDYYNRKSNLLQLIDYDVVSEKLTEMKTASLNFLKGALYN